MNPRKATNLPAITLLTGLLCLQCTSAGENIEGKVVGVSDGDTITVLNADRKQRKIRLHQIDAPEKKQDYGMKSKRSLADLVFGKPVTVEVAATDKYGRDVGKVWIGETDANLEQVKRGMAWVYRKYVRDPAYLAAEETARKAKIGLWAQDKPVPPWEFRHDGNSASPANGSAFARSIARHLLRLFRLGV